MKRKDFIIIAIVAVIAAGLLLYWSFGRTIAPVKGQPSGSLVLLTPAPTPNPTPAIMGLISPSAAAEPEATPRPTLYPAKSYLRVITSAGEYDLIPLLGEAQFKLTQSEGVENIIEIGIDRIVMHSSTCENQDCVGQGEVTLENRDSRVLYDMIICLPNQVMLQLLDSDEAQTLWESYDE